MVAKLVINITAEDYDKIFVGNKDKIKSHRILYTKSKSTKANESLPSRFLSVVRGVKSTYLYSKDKDLWKDYCRWCDIICDRIPAVVIIEGNYRGNNYAKIGR